MKITTFVSPPERSAKPHKTKSADKSDKTVGAEAIELYNINGSPSSVLTRSNRKIGELGEGGK